VAGLAAAFGRGSMTNNWTDMANASCVFVMGANPVENHPASMAHINAARAKGASLIVVDPRKTRTALQADRYIRMRPGTDIAFINGLIKGIIDNMEARDVADPARVAWFAYLNRTDNGTFFTDGNALGDTTSASTSTTPVPGGSKYTDARFLVKADATDYDRERILASTGVTTATGPDNTTISNYPKRAATVDADANTVYNRLKAHVAPYTDAVVAEICGCTTADVAFVVDAFIANSRCSSTGGGTFGANTQDPRVTGYKALTMLYAMGLTQHTNGGQNVKSFAQIQTLMGNMGRAGGGINALRGIHNVQGSTDMGLLYGNIPAYSANPSVMTSADANAFGKYMNALWGTPLAGTALKTNMNNSYDDAYVLGQMALQQRGFYNMTLNWFSNPSWHTAPDRAGVNAVYDLWPKTNGDDHITMFRKMGYAEADPARIKAAVVWGQNPAVTEPNQSAVRAGLKNLDVLVLVDMFETETAACQRKSVSGGDASDGVTYLIPACAHTEEAGSVTNSGRILQWRERTSAPKGNSKADLELLLRFNKALQTAGAFSHIEAVWTAQGRTFTSAFDTLYGTKYGWTPGGGTAFEDVTFSDPNTQVWTGTAAAPSAGGTTLTGSEAMCEKIFREMAAPSASGGTIWIYTGAYNAGGTWTTDNKSPSAAAWQVYNRAKSRDTADGTGTLTGLKLFGAWGYSWLVNRRVLYNNSEVPGDVGDFFMGPDSASRLFVSTSTAVLNYARWYRTIHRLADQPDVTITGKSYTNLASPHFIAKTDLSGNVTFAGRFSAHTEPYETNKATIVAAWGRNTKGGAQWDLVKSDTNVAGKTVGHAIADYPLILTTIRCVEHFQGGPTTRNNAWNVEAEPEPWIEINPIDARAKSIVHGDMVNVITARSNSTTDQTGRTKTGYDTAQFGKGFRARVDNTVTSMQRVAPGVVAIPWHWGDRGLSQGSRANDLCIDAFDANTAIPEYKACLCRIQKI
jgi:anaerobic selenocysteine-containing dehydrogenase